MGLEELPHYLEGLGRATDLLGDGVGLVVVAVYQLDVEGEDGGWEG